MLTKWNYLGLEACHRLRNGVSSGALNSTHSLTCHQQTTKHTPILILPISKHFHKNKYGDESESTYSSKWWPLVISVEVTGDLEWWHGLFTEYVWRGQRVQMLHARWRNIPETYCAVFMTTTATSVEYFMALSYKSRNGNQCNHQCCGPQWIMLRVYKKSWEGRHCKDVRGHYERERRI